LTEEQAREALIADLRSLAELWCGRRRHRDSWRAGSAVGRSGQILLILDECDHVAHHPAFQDTLVSILRNCDNFRVLLSTRQFPRPFCGQFKVAHYELKGLHPVWAARLFLRRGHRRIRWGEILPVSMRQGLDAEAQVELTTQNEKEVLTWVARHPVVAGTMGSPKDLIALADRVTDSLPSISDLAASPPVVAPASQP